MPERLPRGLLDTSVVVDLEHLGDGRLPEEVAISAVTLAELCAGPAATTDPDERARRQDRLQRTEAVLIRCRSGLRQLGRTGVSTPPSLPPADSHAVASPIS